MNQPKRIKTALISVFYKENLAPIIKQLHADGVTLLSTGGTRKFIEDLNIPCQAVEDLTSYPSILGGRVKTLHPKVFGGILTRRANESDQKEIAEFEIPEIDLVIVDLYPFEETVKSDASAEDIIEKIDIGGISLIRAAAKNFNDVLIVSSRNQYADLLKVIQEGKGSTSIENRRRFAAQAFQISSHYDTAIFNYFNKIEEIDALKISEDSANSLRYGENPHQKGTFFGNMDELFDKLHGKELSYNNLLDVDAAVNLIGEFTENDPTFAILKHNNACGIATRATVLEAYEAALAGDPVSAFGGVLITNQTIDDATAEAINPLFCEVVIAPSYSETALTTLQSKKNRIILVQKQIEMPTMQYRSILNGALVQDKDLVTDKKSNFRTVTRIAPTAQELDDLEFASKLVKQTKSNAIILAKNGQLLAGGTGQTSRVDALNQAIKKAKEFNFDLNGAVMASDAFFPFPDCVEIAKNAGITAVIQPGGSIKDELSIDYCNNNGLAMVFTGTRHFKH